MTLTIDYKSMMSQALQAIIRNVLKLVEDQGLVGRHYFYISFITSHPGVMMSQYMLHKYPHEITIVLQHQFNDLRVHMDHFEVTLSFSGVLEKLRVPFSAISSFNDPSVNLQLQCTGDVTGILWGQEPIYDQYYEAAIEYEEAIPEESAHHSEIWDSIWDRLNRYHDYPHRHAGGSSGGASKEHRGNGQIIHISQYINSSQRDNKEDS